MPDPATPEGALPSLRTLICAGEALPASLARRWRPGRVMLNAYGPTEVAICATVGEVGEGVDRGEPPGVGLPLPGVSTVVVDERLAPVAVGTPGELLVGGCGVGRGYRGRPDLTSERFVPSPGGGRCYRTGDRVVEAGDGSLTFLGRLDDQVKLAGVRIEPQEIGEVLREHPRVADAAVDIRGGRLVAWTAGGSPGMTELREWCAARLPQHMVPKAFVALEAMPRTPAGKIDRHALPDPARSDAGLSSDSGTEPMTPIETSVAALFEELLACGRVARGDDFFALGGKLADGRQARRAAEGATGGGGADRAGVRPADRDGHRGRGGGRR